MRASELTYFILSALVFTAAACLMILAFWFHLTDRLGRSRLVWLSAACLALVALACWMAVNEATLENAGFPTRSGLRLIGATAFAGVWVLGLVIVTLRSKR